MTTTDHGSEAASDAIKVGTRRSALALRQAENIVADLKRAHPALDFAVCPVSVMGDRDKTTPLPDLGKGLWTSELEAQLLGGQLDLIVHCLKDMPTSVPSGCVIAAISEREDPRDAVLFPSRQNGAYSALADLPQGSVVGTSSVRRMAQLRRRYPTLSFRDVRGNIDTRLRKLDDESLGYDCIILAAAGLKRMGLEGRIAQYLTAESGMLHAVGQGALGLEAREGDERIVGLLRGISHRPSELAGTAERVVMRTLEGGCSVPIGVETRWEGNRLHFAATVVSLTGDEAVEAKDEAEVTTEEEANTLGKRVAQALVERGASQILSAINASKNGAAGAVKVGET